MHAHTVNYRERDGARRGQQLVNVGFFLHGTPRLTLWCRLFGHRPVVDGTEPTGLTGSTYRGPGYRWVCCDRCGVRGEPQGNLDPGVYAIGDRYAGDWGEPPPARPRAAADYLKSLKDVGYHPPGQIPRSSTGALGGQLVLGPGGFGGLGWEVKVGNCGSEHTLAASVHFGPLGALYLHTERHGTWWQRRLNPDGYESRITGVRFVAGRLEWRFWSRRDNGSRYGPNAEPWWRNGELNLRWRDKLLGPRRYVYTDVDGGNAARLVRMPEDDYLVVLKLQRCTLGRRRGRKTRSWSVDWNAPGKGIPTKGPGRGRIYGSGVTVSDQAVRAGTWPAEAAAAIAARMTRDRTSHRWEPTGRVPIDTATAAA